MVSKKMLHNMPAISVRLSFVDCHPHGHGPPFYRFRSCFCRQKRVFHIPINIIQIRSINKQTYRAHGSRCVARVALCCLRRGVALVVEQVFEVARFTYVHLIITAKPRRFLGCCWVREHIQSARLAIAAFKVDEPPSFERCSLRVSSAVNKNTLLKFVWRVVLRLGVLNECKFRKLR